MSLCCIAIFVSCGGIVICELQTTILEAKHWWWRSSDPYYCCCDDYRSPEAGSGTEVDPALLRHEWPSESQLHLGIFTETDTRCQWHSLDGFFGQLEKVILSLLKFSTWEVKVSVWKGAWRAMLLCPTHASVGGNGNPAEGHPILCNSCSGGRCTGHPGGCVSRRAQPCAQGPRK